MNVLKPSIHALKYTLSKYEPMQRIYIDTININRPDKYGYQHIIVMIDAFTRWVELVPTTDLTALSAARALLCFIGRFGVPDEIQSDKGTQYMNDILTNLSNIVGYIQKFNIASYSHEENGMVERANKEVMRHLRAIIFEKNTMIDWSDNLPLIQRIINVSENENIGVSASQLVYGNKIDLNKGIFLPSSLSVNKNSNSSVPYHTWLADRLRAQESIISKAQKLQEEINNKRLSSIITPLTQYHINDYVLVDYPNDQLKVGPPSKLLTNRRGPMQIVNKSDNDLYYTLKDLTTNKENIVVHVSRLHTFYYDSDITNPISIAYKDSQLYEIDEIIEHIGDKKHPSKMKFKVKWMSVNDSPQEITWEPFSSLRATVQLHQYLNQNKMRSLIPNDYK
jgi:hypothetical protein